jgi:hypothetical protein
MVPKMLRPSREDLVVILVVQLEHGNWVPIGGGQLAYLFKPVNVF